MSAQEQTDKLRTLVQQNGALMTKVAQESTLLAESQTIQSAIQNIDLSSVENKVDEVKQAVENIDLTPIESKVDEGVSTLSSKIDNIDFSAVENKVQEESAAIQAKIDNIKLPEIDTTELAKEATLQEVKSSIDGISVPLSAISGLALELEGGKKNIANALKARGVESSVNTDTLTDMAAKVYEVKNPVAFTVPAETSNEWANVMFNTMIKSQGYDKMYAEVVKTYCSEGGVYVGCLMTALYKQTYTSINLIGADAYYIYEENIFYKAGVGGKLIQFLNGVETQLSSTQHAWDSDNTSYQRTVFYLYLPNSTANGVRENTHYSRLDYCHDTTIPVINIQNRGGAFVHLHVKNNETCVIYQTNQDVPRMTYFYTNLKKSYGNKTLLYGQSCIDLTSLEEVGRNDAANVNIIYTDFLDSINLPNLTSSKVYALLIGRFKKVELPQLQHNDGGILATTAYIRELEIHLPNLISSTMSSNYSIVENHDIGELRLYLRSKAEINSMFRGQNNRIKKLLVFCDELYHYGENNYRYPDLNAKEIYFQGLKKGNIYVGDAASYSNTIEYMYINCIGDREDEIYIYHKGREYGTSVRNHYIEISEGTRQPLSFLEFIYMSADNIVNYIFKKLADNRFEDDGVTPAPAIKIAIGATCLAKLTDAQKAIATDKNYILA
jgi:hypothetical protein